MVFLGLGAVKVAVGVVCFPWEPSFSNLSRKLVNCALVGCRVWCNVNCVWVAAAAALDRQWPCLSFSGLYTLTSR